MHDVKDRHGLQLISNALKNSNTQALYHDTVPSKHANRKIPKWIMGGYAYMTLYATVKCITMHAVAQGIKFGPQPKI